MLHKILHNFWKLLLVAVIVSLLALVRAYENQLFYDPFLDYFKDDFNALPLPYFNLLQFLLGLLFRYTLNTVLSLGILFVLFHEMEIVKFASILYAIFFIVLIVVFFAILYFYGEHNNLLLFYVRRFLIQPVFVILFIPAFYYQKRNS